MSCRIARTALLTAAVLCLALTVECRPAHAQAGYFGTAKATVAYDYELPLPGFPGWNAPVLFDQKSWCQADECPHPTTCLVDVDPVTDQSGTLTQPRFLAIDSHLVYNVFYQGWVQAGGFHFSPDSPPACSALLNQGKCLKVSGHIDAAVGLSGLTYVVDSLAPCQ